MGTWETVRVSEILRTLTPADEETCKPVHDRRALREIIAKKRFFRVRPDGIAHHNKKRMWYLMEFKHTSDVLPDYLERKDSMESKQYENFMNIFRKAKNPGWTSDQLNFIVGSKSINENVMDTNLEKIGITQKKERKSKVQQSRQISIVSSTSLKPITLTHTMTYRSQQQTKGRRHYISQ
jgi:hypothetical protein